MKMKCTPLVFAVLALLAGLVSAWHWFKSASADHPDPTIVGNFVDIDGKPSKMKAWMKDTAERNRKAAGWAAASVVMGAISNIIGALC